MPIASWLMAGLMAFVLLGPTVMVAVLVSGLARRGGPAEVADQPTTAPVTGSVTRAVPAFDEVVEQPLLQAS